MKHIIKGENGTGATITINGVSFLVLTPLVIFYNRLLFEEGGFAGDLLSNESAGNLDFTDYADVDLTAAELFETVQQMQQQSDSCSTMQEWYSFAGAAMESIIYTELEAFNFGGAGVTKTRLEVMDDLWEVVTALHGGLLTDAQESLQAITYDTTSDFLNQTRLELYDDMLTSALTTLT